MNSVAGLLKDPSPPSRHTGSLCDDSLEKQQLSRGWHIGHAPCEARQEMHKPGTSCSRQEQTSWSEITGIGELHSQMGIKRESLTVQKLGAGMRRDVMWSRREEECEIEASVWL